MGESIGFNKNQEIYGQNQKGVDLTFNEQQEPVSNSPRIEESEPKVMPNL